MVVGFQVLRKTGKLAFILMLLAAGSSRAAPELRVTFDKTMKRLGVHMPWQEGKTTLCSEYYPAWKILLNPQHRIILGSHAD